MVLVVMNVSWEKIKRILFFLLSHHTEEYAHRTLRIKFRDRELRLCARCSGLTMGFLLGVVVHFYFWNRLYLTEPVAILLVVFSLMPALLDWGTQSLLERESKNWLRVMTGFLLGFGICFIKFISFLTLLVLILTFYVIAAIIVFIRITRGGVKLHSKIL